MIWQYELCSTQANMIWWYERCFAQLNERELERQWIKAQTPRYVTRFEPLALHPRLHHRVGFPIHCLPPREPLLKRICYNSRSTKLLSQTTTSQPRGRPVANTTTNPPHTWGIQTNTPPLTRGSKPITSTKEGYNKNKGVYNKWFQRPQTISLSFLFSTKTRS